MCGTPFKWRMGGSFINKPGRYFYTNKLKIILIKMFLHEQKKIKWPNIYHMTLVKCNATVSNGKS